MVDFRTIETFVWVAKLVSFRGAAAKLHTSQPAVSLRIANLEDELGVRLLDRDRRTVALTERGRLLLEHAERLLRVRADMIQAVADRSSVRGTLRLGVAETIVHTWLSRFLDRVNASHPRLALEIEVDVSADLRDRLLAQEIDLAFMVGPVSAPTIRSRYLCTYPVAFVASPKLALPNGRVAIETIAKWPVMTFARNTQPYVHIREVLLRPDLPPPRIHASASLATIVRMALDGIGIAAIPPPIVTNDLAAGRLRRLTTDIKVPDLQFVASWVHSADPGLVEELAALAAEVAQRPSPRTAGRTLSRGARSQPAV